MNCKNEKQEQSSQQKSTTSKFIFRRNKPKKLNKWDAKNIKDR